MTNMYFSPPVIHLISEFSLSVVCAFITSFPASFSQSASFRIAQFHRYDLQCKQALITLFHTKKRKKQKKQEKKKAYFGVWLISPHCTALNFLIPFGLFYSSHPFPSTLPFSLLYEMRLEKDLGRGGIILSLEFIALVFTYKPELFSQITSVSVTFSDCSL